MIFHGANSSLSHLGSAGGWPLSATLASGGGSRSCCPLPAGTMPIGVMLRWNEEKGFGFIRPMDGEGPDLFCHKSALLDGDGSVWDGDEVKFVMEYDERKGKDRAIEVERYIRSSQSPPPQRPPPPSARREGDWDCPKCKFMVFATKSECMKCGTRREDADRIREEMAEASKKESKDGKKDGKDGKDAKEKDAKDHSRDRRRRRSREKEERSRGRRRERSRSRQRS
ncbi:unnamed protein product [Durusdinium trenchii]|uniref:Uncharacterized protein n=1 Tax=Durusdinium trenchii TaxID=1381693 RepID=A0ABP0QZ02_9DINO